ncbi:short-chain dehydrogenase [Sinorhizobium medicae]|nr:short-chain dehydrogenase [Sinorhizobium medicae]
MGTALGKRLFQHFRLSSERRLPQLSAKAPMRYIQSASAHRECGHYPCSPAIVIVVQGVPCRCIPHGPRDVIEAEFFARDCPTSLIQRMIEPQEIASLVAYVASPLSAATDGVAR